MTAANVPDSSTIADLALDSLRAAGNALKQCKCNPGEPVGDPTCPHFKAYRAACKAAIEFGVYDEVMTRYKKGE